MGKDLTQLTGSQKDALNEIKKFIFDKKSLDYYQLISLIGRAGYKTKINGGGHNEVYFDNERLRNEEGLPILFSQKKSSMTPGNYKKILRALLLDLESRYEI